MRIPAIKMVSAKNNRNSFCLIGAAVFRVYCLWFACGLWVTCVLLVVRGLFVTCGLLLVVCVLFLVCCLVVVFFNGHVANGNPCFG